MNTVWSWARDHKWKLLLVAMVSLLMISPISEVYDQQDNIITPLTSIVFIAVIFGTAEGKWTRRFLTAFALVWLVISIVTDGSGLFAGLSLLAPIMFMFLLVAIFFLLIRWMIRVNHINAEVLCAAVCGYLLLGILWMCLYAVVATCIAIVHPDHAPAFSTSTGSNITFSDLLYFSYVTLTTTGFGDIIPRAPTIRMLAVMEAIVGVFYNTIVIARLSDSMGSRNEIP